MEIELLITDDTGQSLSAPILIEGMEWSTKRRGSPGKLTFKVLQDGALKITEGSHVRLMVDGQKVFYGFVFSRSWDKSQEISVIAYDQLRYLQNKDVFQYTATAAGLVQLLAADFHLQTGNLEDTGYTIVKRLEDNKSLFEMIENALDLTMLNTKEIYVLYDDFGKLALKNISSLQLDLIIDEETGENFEYQSSIDSDTYNQVKLVYENKKAGKREIYKTNDPVNINHWGVLQYFDTLKEQENGQAKADALLGIYNKKKQSIKIRNALGDIRVRAGCIVIVQLNLGDVKLKNRMMVEEATHKFNDQEHLMDLTLRGGKFDV